MITRNLSCKKGKLRCYNELVSRYKELLIRGNDDNEEISHDNELLCRYRTAKS